MIVVSGRVEWDQGSKIRSGPDPMQAKCFGSDPTR